MNLLQKRISATVHSFFFVVVLLSLGFKFCSWPAALLCSASCVAVQILTFACSLKRDFIFFAISCVGGVVLAISHFQAEASFVPDIALIVSLLLVFAVRLVLENRFSRPVWMLAFIFLPASLLVVRFYGFGISFFQQIWLLASVCCTVATGLMGLIPFGKARMTTEYWVSSAVIACLAAFLIAAVFEVLGS